MKFGKSAQQKGRFVGVSPVAGGSVCGFADRDVSHAVEQTVDCYQSLGSCQRRTGAGMDSASEGDVFAYVLAVEAKFMRVFELVRISVRGTKAQH